MAWVDRTRIDEMWASILRGCAKLLNCLVDLIGIEPMTSSMPFTLILVIY